MVTWTGGRSSSGSRCGRTEQTVWRLLRWRRHGVAVNLGVYPHKPLGWSAVGEAWPCADFYFYLFFFCPLLLFIFWRVTTADDHDRGIGTRTLVSRSSWYTAAPEIWVPLLDDLRRSKISRKENTFWNVPISRFIWWTLGVNGKISNFLNAESSRYNVILSRVQNDACRRRLKSANGYLYLNVVLFNFVIEVHQISH